MSRVVTILCLTCVAAMGATAWIMLGPGASERIAVPTAPAATPLAPGPGLAQELHDARRSCQLAAVDAVVQRAQEACRREPENRDQWHLLAEAHLERSLLRSHDLGMTVGEPLFPEPPPELRADLDAGLAAAAKARALGDDSGELYRIEAGLMSQQITGLGSALQWNGKIQDALRLAGERAPDNPHLHVALGLRKLLAPRWLGQDPAKALEHFEFADRGLAADERPAVFAAMASYLLDKRQKAIAWLERALARNQHNRFARVVLQRLRAGEADAFGRDVTAAEAAAAK